MPMIKCPNCGEEIDEKNERCLKCGHDLKKEITTTPKRRGRPKKVNTIKCEDCKIEYDIALTECPNCGCPKPEVMSNPKQAIFEYIFCEECGSKISQDNTECPNCGYPIQHKVNLAPVIVKDDKTKKAKIKKQNKDISKIFFFIFLALFFLAGCFTAVVLSNTLKNKAHNETDTNPIEYKINRTLSCVSEDGFEEHNYYFDKNTLVQYSKYFVKDFETDSKANSEIKKFKNKWENDSSSSIISAHKNGTIVTESLVIDLINSNNIELDDDINLKDSYTNIKKQMEKNKYTCKEYNEDLGTKLPINEINKETNN